MQKSIKVSIFILSSREPAINFLILLYNLSMLQNWNMVFDAVNCRSAWLHVDIITKYNNRNKIFTIAKQLLSIKESETIPIVLCFGRKVNPVYIHRIINMFYDTSLKNALLSRVQLMYTWLCAFSLYVSVVGQHSIT